MSLALATVGEVSKLMEEAAADPTLTEHEARRLIALGALILQHMTPGTKALGLKNLGLFETSWQHRLMELSRYEPR